MYLEAASHILAFYSTSSDCDGFHVKRNYLEVLCNIPSHLALSSLWSFKVLICVHISWSEMVIAVQNMSM